MGLFGNKPKAIKRKASINRKTNEVDIKGEFTIDGEGKTIQESQAGLVVRNRPDIRNHNRSICHSGKPASG